MCGIAGIVNFTKKVNHGMSIVEMLKVLGHRGPDATGHYISTDGKVVFGHNRLSICGLDSKATIMSIPKKKVIGKEIAIVFNGEIYNFKELKSYFAKKGYTSVSPSDFEVIVFAWQEWGEKCVDHLIGEFVFVLFDEETDEIFVARDRTGVKPLFYTITDQGEFLFASEPKAILAYPNVEKKINVDSVAEFLLMGHTFAAGLQNEKSSYYENINQFPAAHCGLLKKGKLTLKQYWDIPISDTKNIRGNVAKVKKVLSKAISQRIPDEVPLSIGLSGGLDSSIIAAQVARSKAQKDMLACCVRYTGDTNDDYFHAKLLAKKDNFKLISPNVSPKEMMSFVDNCISSVDGPVDSIRRMGMHANYKHISDAGFKVVMIGEGADEFNLGYYHKFPGLKVDVEQCSTARNVKQLFFNRWNYVKHFFKKSWQDKIDFTQMINHIVKVNYEQCKSKKPLSRMEYFYAKKFLQYLEDGNDRAASTYSLEARLPFVDPDVIKTCLAVPLEQNIVSTGEKKVLRDAFKDVLPKEIYKRAKAPFPANEDLELHKLIHKELKKEITLAKASVWKLLDKKFILRFSQEFTAKFAELEKKHGKNKGGQELTAWLPITKPVELRTNQMFSLFTLLKWHRLNFN